MRKGPKPHPLALARKKFSRHRAQARFRGIDFLFDFDTWYAWWLSHGVDKNTDTVWDSKGRLCMCRYGDTGPYEPSNVYCDTHANNSRVMDHTFQRRRKRIYSWDGMPVNLHELEGLCPEVRDNVYLRSKFKKTNYDHSVRQSLRQLTNRYRETWGGDKKRRWFEGVTCWWRHRHLAAKDHGINIDCYVSRERRGIEGYRTHLAGPSYTQYLEQNTPFPNFVDYCIRKGYL